MGSDRRTFFASILGGFAAALGIKAGVGGSSYAATGTWATLEAKRLFHVQNYEIKRAVAEWAYWEQKNLLPEVVYMEDPDA